jgi:hypothetical protein
MSGRLTIAFVTAFALSVGSLIETSRAAPAPALEYDFFKTRVQPIFLKKRDGHERCALCHAGANNALHLAPLSPGATAWDDEQTRANFVAVSALVNRADPANSRLLIHPLAPEAGGDLFHSGGRQFASKNDPDWKTLAEFAGVK